MKISFQRLNAAENQWRLYLPKCRGEPSQKLFLQEKRALCVGFGMVITLAFSVPILSVLILPIAVVSGTQ